MKPQLADNWNPKKQMFPVYQQPKVDGVRGLHITGAFTGRSLKAFKNKALNAFYNHPLFAGVDGELCMPGGMTQDRLCSVTTGTTSRHNGVCPDIVLFDLLTPTTVDQVYEQRYRMLDARVKLIHQEVEGAAQRVNLIPIYTVFSVEQALELNDKFLDWGYEGSILRPTQALLKEGRPDKAQQLMRIKGFIDVEARCTGIYEALENQNEAKVNELGRTERSSHKENKIGKNMLGGLSIVFEQDIVHNGEVLFKAGTTSKCGPGTMTHNERFYYWVNPGEIVGQMIKLKLFPQGIKEKARMGTFLSLRSAEDMS